MDLTVSEEHYLYGMVYEMDRIARKYMKCEKKKKRKKIEAKFREMAAQYNREIGFSDTAIPYPFFEKKIGAYIRGRENDEWGHSWRNITGDPIILTPGKL